MLNLKKDLGLFVLILVIGTVVAVINPRFLSAVNISNTANLVGLFGMFSIGQAFVIITGGIELSVGSMIALLGVIFVDLIASRGVPWPVASLIILAMGVLMGLAHGLLITKKRMQPFVVTLCGLLIYRGIARFYTADATAGFPFGVRFEYLEYLTTGRTDIVGLLTGDAYTSIPIPHSFFFMLIVAAIMWVVLHRTVFGRHLYAVGKNEEAARFSGIRTDRVILAAYAICGVLAAVSSIFLAMYTRSILPSSHGNFYELYAIAAAVLGGFSLRGGEGSIVGVVLGAILLQVLQNLVNLLGIPSSLNFAVSGSVILIGVLADQEYANFRERRERLRRLASATGTSHIDDPPTGNAMPAAGARRIDRDS
jgi:ribose transport system permease protein